jgi:hypothetical protein
MNTSQQTQEKTLGDFLSNSRTIQSKKHINTHDEKYQKTRPLRDEFHYMP